MALVEFLPNQLVLDTIYDEITGHNNGAPIFGRRGLYFMGRVGANLEFTSRADPGGRIYIPVVTQSTFSTFVQEDDILPDSPASNYSDSSHEDADEEGLPGSQGFTDLTALGKYLKRKRKSKKRKSRKTRRRKTRRRRR